MRSAHLLGGTHHFCCRGDGGLRLRL